MGDVGGLVISSLLGLLVLAAAVVFVGRAIGRRMRRRHGGRGAGPVCYELDPDVRLDAELYDRVRELMRDDSQSEAVAALRAATKGLGREDAEAIADAIATGALDRPGAGEQGRPGASGRTGAEGAEGSERPDESSGTDERGTDERGAD